MEGREKQDDCVVRLLGGRAASICSKEGVTLADTVETLGVDLRTKVKKLGAKEKARRKKCKVRFSLFKKNEAFQKNSMKGGGSQEVVTSGVWYQQELGEFMQWGWAPTERLKLRRQMAAAAGKNSTTSLSLFVETYGAWMEQMQEVQLWKQVRGPAGTVMCETRDLGKKWPQWNTLIFEGEVRIDMRYVCPKDVKNMFLQRAKDSLLEKVGSKSMNVKN